MTTSYDVAGTAALAICESLMLALNDHNILPEKDIMGILTDAASTHRNAVANGSTGSLHEAVADLIDAMIAGGNSVRRPGR